VPAPQVSERRFDLEVQCKYKAYASRFYICIRHAYILRVHICCSCRRGPRSKSLRASTSSSRLSAASRPIMSTDGAVAQDRASSVINQKITYPISPLYVHASPSCTFYPVRVYYCSCMFLLFVGVYAPL
jgi:hypothetical protein